MPLPQSAGAHPDEDGGEPAAGSPAGPTPASLLTGHDDAFGFGPEQPCDSARSGLAERAGEWDGGDGPLPPGTDLGGVTIERLLGEGGMGRVYAGWQATPRRRVAIKVIRPVGLTGRHDIGGHVTGRHADGVERRERFVREAEFLARLRHPHIAQIHTFGLHAASGVAARPPLPFFVMELVEDARPITRHAALRRLGIRERVTLFRKVCGAVGHAHEQGVVHRDLKPANVLVGSDGEPKVIDFGVARADGASVGGLPADQRPAGLAGSALTRSGDVVGTLHYMSPEQLDGEATAVDGRSDVYALGLILHQLLTGGLPYDLDRASLAEAVRLMCGDAAPDTTRVEQAAAAECGRDDARALATLVAKCLEKRPADRYQSAGAVAAELDRWLAGEPILARPPTALESIRRFARRHRAAAAAILGVAATILVALVGISLFGVQAERQRREADRQAAEARTQLYFSNVLLAAEARDRDNIAEARRLLESARNLVADAGTSRPIELNCLAASLDESLDVLAPAGLPKPPRESAEGDRFDGQAVDRGVGDEPPKPRPPTVTAVAGSPAGEMLAVGDWNGGLRVWRQTTPEAVGGGGSGRPAVVSLDGHEDVVWAVAWAPDGTWLASASADGQVAVWNVADGRCVARLTAHDGPVYAVDVSPDGTMLVTAGRDGTVRVWSTRTWEEQGTFQGHRGTVFGVAVSPDGLAVASSGADRTVRLWSLASGEAEAVLGGHCGRVFDVAFSPGNTLLATASEDGTARVWDLRRVFEAGRSAGSTARDGGTPDSPGEVARLEHPLRVNALCFVEGTNCLATASGDGMLRVWDLTGSHERLRRRGHAAALWSIACRPGRAEVATGSADGTVRVWDVAPERDLACAYERGVACAYERGVACAHERGDPMPVMREHGRVLALAWAPDAGLVAAGLADGRVHLRDATTLRTVGELQGGNGRVNAVAFSPDGRELAAGCDQGTVCAWRLPEAVAGIHGLQATPFTSVQPHSRRVYCVAYGPDGTRLATAGEDGTARVWHRPAATDAGLGGVQAVLKHPRRVFCVAFTPDGRHVATACEDRRVRLWDPRDGREVRQFGIGEDRHGGPVNWLAFTMDGERLATASSDATVRLWRVADGRLLHVLQGPARQIWKVAFSPDGRRVAAVSADGTAQIWDAGSGRAALMLRGHADQAWAVAFAPSGDALLTGGWDRTLRVWGLSAAELARRRRAAP